MMYMKIIIIPPKNASVKINGIQGLEVSIHLIIIIVDENIRIHVIRMIGDMFVIKIIEVIIMAFARAIQSIVYFKILILGIKE